MRCVEMDKVIDWLRKGKQEHQADTHTRREGPGSEQDRDSV